MDTFFSWEILGTYAGAAVATGLFTQALKGLGPLARVPTRLVSYFVALFVLLGAHAAAGTLTFSAAGLCVVNAVVVAFAANGGYDAMAKPTKPPQGRQT